MRRPLLLVLGVVLVLAGVVHAQEPGDPAVGKPLAQLITALKDPDANVRERAAFNIGWRRAKAAAAVPALVEALRDKNISVRSNVASALAAIGKPALPALRKALRSGDPVLREGAGWALERCRRCAVPVLVTALRNKDAKVRAVAADALAGMGPFAAKAVPALVVALRDKNQAVRLYATAALGCIGPRAKAAVPALIAILKDPSKRLPPRTLERPGLLPRQEALRADERVDAADALAAIGPAAKAAVPALIAMLKEEDESTREHAAEALGAIGPLAKDAVPTLLSLVKDEESISVQYAAALAVWQIARCEEALAKLTADLQFEVAKGCVGLAAHTLGKMGPESLPALLRAAKDPHLVDGDVLLALGMVGSGNKAAVAVLREALKRKNARLRQSALSALLFIGPAAKAATPELLVILERGEGFLQDLAVMVLASIEPPSSAAPALVRLLRSRNRWIRRAAADTLGRIRPASDAAVPALIAALSDKTSSIRLTTIRALGNIGPAARKALPSLEAARKDSNPMVILHAAVAVWKIGRRTKEVLPVLVRMLRAGAAQPRRDLILEAFGDMGSEAKEAVAELKKLAKDEDPTLALGSIVALWRIDRAYPSPLPRLLDALQDDDERTRSEARNLLATLGPDARPAVPALIRMWQTEPPSMVFGKNVGQRYWLARLLRKIDPEAALKAGIR